MTPLTKVGLTLLMVLVGVVPAVTLFVDPLPSRSGGARTPGGAEVLDEDGADVPTVENPPQGEGGKQVGDDERSGSQERATRRDRSDRGDHNDRIDRQGLRIRIGFGGDPDDDEADDDD